MTFTTPLHDAAALLAPVRVDARTSDRELLAITSDIERVGRLVDALRTSAAAEISRRSDRSLGHDGLAARNGHRTPSSLLASLTLVSGKQADRRARIAQLIEPLPELAHAVADGAISTDAAESIGAALSPVASLAADVVAPLIELASVRPADEVASAARAARDQLDALGVEQRERDLRAQRYLRFGREIDGMVPIRGLLPPEDAGIVQALFDARTSVRRTVSFFAEGDRPPRSSDDRTLDQLRADTLVEISRVAAGALTVDAADSPLMNGAGTVVVTIDHESLLSELGTAGVEGVAGSISASSARRIACTARILPIVLGGRSQPIDFGQSRRLFSAIQRRALALRDRGCAAVGCDAPPGWTEAHHITPWSRGGPTDLSNGVLLCSFHHHQVHLGKLLVQVRDGLAQVTLAPQPVPLAPPPQDRRTLSRRAPVGA
ncbi:HNH endonuclease signature motif containing protein [soil metagenome]